MTTKNEASELARKVYDLLQPQGATLSLEILSILAAIIIVKSLTSNEQKKDLRIKFLEHFNAMVLDMMNEDKTIQH